MARFNLNILHFKPNAPEYSEYTQHLPQRPLKTQTFHMLNCKGTGGNTWKTTSLWHISDEVCSLSVWPSCPQFVSANPDRRCCCDKGTDQRRSDRLLRQPKTSLPDMSKMDQLEARRGKGLAIKFSPLEKQKEKSKGRERGDMEREGGGARRPPIFSSLPPLPPSLSLPPFLLFSLLSFLEKVAGQS